MDQNIWGPAAWLFLHSVTMNYKVKPSEIDKQKIRDLFDIIKEILPCKFCRNNYTNHIKKHPIKLDSKKELVYWLIDIHNMVNIQEGKKTMSYEDVLAMYEDLYGKKINLNCTENYSISISKSKSIYYDILLVLFILLLLFLCVKI